MNVWSSALVGLAGLLGAAGVAAAALAAHGKFGPDLGIAANFLLFQAPAICAIALSSQRASAFYLTAASLIALGVFLFSADLTIRATLHAAPLPLAAPTGGSIMVLGWLMLAAAGVASALKK